MLLFHGIIHRKAQNDFYVHQPMPKRVVKVQLWQWKTIKKKLLKKTTTFLLSAFTQNVHFQLHLCSNKQKLTFVDILANLTSLADSCCKPNNSKVTWPVRKKSIHSCVTEGIFTTLNNYKKKSWIVIFGN